MSNTRTVLLTAGNDWYDASADLLEVPANMDLEAEKAKWREWYDKEYCPALKLHQESPQHARPKLPEFICFTHWLRKAGVTYNETIETFHVE